MTSNKHIDIGDPGFVAYVILYVILYIVLYIVLDIIQPKEIPQGHLWQKILVVILDLNAVQLLMNKSAHGELTK
jgi:hypothetical protein